MGVHLANLRRLNHKPRIMPCWEMAWKEYSEQVGSYRQAAGKKGETAF